MIGVSVIGRFQLIQSTFFTRIPCEQKQKQKKKRSFSSTCNSLFVGFAFFKKKKGMVIMFVTEREHLDIKVTA